MYDIKNLKIPGLDKNLSYMFLLPLLGYDLDYWETNLIDCTLSPNDTVLVHAIKALDEEMMDSVEAYNRKMLRTSGYIKSYDSKENEKIHIYEFRVPRKWQEDFDKIIMGNIRDTSQDYQKLIRKTFPEFSENGFLNIIFANMG